MAHMRESQILTENLINVKLNQSTFDIPSLNCVFDIDLRNLIVLQSNLNLRAPVVSFYIEGLPKINFQTQINFNFKKGMKAILGNHTTSLIHDGSDEINDIMEETNDVIPVNGEKP
jgi:hypothetical protein